MDPSARRLLGLSIVGCAACCAAPLLGAAGLGTASLGWFASSGNVVAGLIGVGAVAAIVVGARKKEASSGETDSAAETTVCRLPPSDRPKRTADFRALFVDALVDRERLPNGVRWILKSDPGRLAESRRLAGLEERCCDGIRFDVSEQGNQIHWAITGPPSASPTLDALYDLPVSVQDDEQAARLWASLDAASCAPGKQP